MGMSNLVNRISDNRKDGYTNESVSAVCKFQAAVESGEFGKINYDALRLVLRSARENTMTYAQMVRMYQQNS